MNNRIKVFRAINNLTQEDLAREIGVTRQTILALENRQYDPSLLLAARIAHYFGKKIEEVFIIDQEDEKRPEKHPGKK